MASLFGDIPARCRILDSGAGLGVLTAAVCDRIRTMKNPRIVDSVLFESDPEAFEQLTATAKNCVNALTQKGHQLNTDIRDDDFVLEWEDRDNSLFATGTRNTFDLAIMNPPYFKIRANSQYAKIAKRLGPSQPNIYSLFMALAIDQLRPGGELVAITPRSFCNGLYFREFRNWLFKRADLLQVHAFGSRSDTFKEAKVLQENIITHFRKKKSAGDSSPKVKVTRSWGRDMISIGCQTLDFDRVVDKSCGDSLICIAENPEDAEIVQIAENWRKRFGDTGLKISTGPVVMFRTREFHRESSGKGTVPLITSHHVFQSRVEWPREKKKWPSAFISDDHSRKHLVNRQNYVLLKRFTSKEEKRRLSAGVLVSASFGSTHLALENHINYITHTDRELTLEEAMGITAVFNSALMDRYFRCLSGNTQVNATEIRTMKFPELKLLSEIGSRLKNDATAESENVVYAVLKVPSVARAYLEGFSL